MTAAKLKDIRNRLRLSRLQLGRAIGYEGNPDTVRRQITKYESGTRDIPEGLARLVMMFDYHGVPAEFLER